MLISRPGCEADDSMEESSPTHTLEFVHLDLEGSTATEDEASIIYDDTRFHGLKVERRYSCFYNGRDIIVERGVQMDNVAHRAPIRPKWSHRWGLPHLPDHYESDLPGSEPRVHHLGHGPLFVCCTDEDPNWLWFLRLHHHEGREVRGPYDTPALWGFGHTTSGARRGAYRPPSYHRTRGTLHLQVLQSKWPLRDSCNSLCTTGSTIVSQRMLVGWSLILMIWRSQLRSSYGGLHPIGTVARSSLDCDEAHDFSVRGGRSIGSHRSERVWDRLWENPGYLQSDGRTTSERKGLRGS